MRRPVPRSEALDAITRGDRWQAAIEDLRRRHRTETAAFTRSLESLIARAKEPAAYAADKLTRLGLNETGAATRWSAGIRSRPPTLAVR
jgi:hypothetical protein